MATAAHTQNPATLQVLQALESPEYRWRTVEGISSDTGLTEDDVRHALSDLPADDLVRTPSRKGLLFTTRRHYDRTKTLKSRILSVLSDMPK